jgi:hypothetical protein
MSKIFLALVPGYGTSLSVFVLSGARCMDKLVPALVLALDLALVALHPVDLPVPLPATAEVLTHRAIASTGRWWHRRR